MRKLFYFFAALVIIGQSSCEFEQKNQNEIDDSIVDVKPTFDVQWLNKKANLKEMLNFLGAKTLSEIQYKVFEYENEYSDKGVLQVSYFVSIENITSKSIDAGIEKHVLLEVFPDDKDVKIVSTVLKNNLGNTIEIVQFDGSEQVDGTILIEYNLEQEFATYSFDGYSKSCWNKCMRSKMKAIFVDGNWIDQAAFIVGLPYSLFWNYASCGWDCI